jgi:hypothetical protein
MKKRRMEDNLHLTEVPDPASKGLSGINRCLWRVAWLDRVVPLAVKIGTGNVDGGHLLDSLTS